MLAADFLTRRGAAIVERNRRVGRSEVDLLARIGGVTVVVEVKTVSGTVGGITAAAHITPTEAAAAARPAHERSGRPGSTFWR